MSIPRTRGALSGVLLILLGAWGALVPLIGPSFGLTIGPDTSWNLTTGRFWLSVLPGIVVAVGGLLLLIARTRPIAVLGAWLGLAGGAWFVVGEQVSQLWNHGVSQAGDALGGTSRRVLEQLVYFDGLGVLIVAIASIALGRLLVRSVRDAEFAAAAAVDDDDEAVVRPGTTTRETGRFDRDDEREPAGATAVAPAATATTTDDGAPESSDTLTAADRVRLAADDEADRGGVRGFFSRRR
jgi:hypothetical protein